MFSLSNTENIISPQLVYFEDIIDENIKKAVDQAHDVKRLWPHVKTHKTVQIVKKLIALGVNKFKCATIAECEMVASCDGVDSILLAYPTVGPNIDRFLAIKKAFPKINWYALFDDIHQLECMNSKALEQDLSVNIFIDVNVGLNRTGVAMDQVTAFVKHATNLQAIKVCGLHCYDGHNGISNLQDRTNAICELIKNENALVAQVENLIGVKPMLIAGGTAEFPVYAEYSDFFLSPGTLFVQDNGYATAFKDMDYKAGAAVLTRVISNPTADSFTLDCGYKAIASDPSGVRGIIAGFENKVDHQFQNEEHWVFKMKPGFEQDVPKVGDVLYVIPTHICPTSALYPSVLVAKDGKVTDTWDIVARNRKITF